MAGQSGTEHAIAAGIALVVAHHAIDARRWRHGDTAERLFYGRRGPYIEEAHQFQKPEPFGTRRTLMLSDITTLEAAARRGNSQAEEELFGLLSARFAYFTHRRIWSRDDAEEVVQEALAVIAKEYKTVEFTESFAAWAYKVLDNRILNFIRSKQREKRNRDQMAEEQSGNFGNAPDLTLKSRLLECLKKVAGANQRYARILNLHYQGFKTNEICDRLSLKPNNCYVVLARARAMLRTCLEEGEAR